MSDVNIKYKKGIVDSKTASIEADITTLLGGKASEYDQILSGFTVSQCDHATVLREQIGKEKEMIDALMDFYTTLVTMIHNASKDVEQVESNYAVNHVTE
ncbi:MAG: hypothetical protein Q4D94_14770 [Bacillota bacterium]|nr:hypothetical protein [Bacillota bacterium]